MSAECPKFNIPCDQEPTCFLINPIRCLSTINNSEIPEDEKVALVEQVNQLTDPFIKYQEK